MPHPAAILGHRPRRSSRILLCLAQIVARARRYNLPCISLRSLAPPMVAFWILATLMTAAGPGVRARSAVARARACRPLARAKSPRRAARAAPRDRERTSPRAAAGRRARRGAGRAASRAPTSDLEAAARVPRPCARRPGSSPTVAAVAVPALAFGIYAAIGTSGGLRSGALVAATAAKTPDDKQIVAHGGEPRGARCANAPTTRRAGRCSRARWPRSAASRNRPTPTSISRSSRPNDPDVLADYADALGMAQGRTLVGPARRAGRAGARASIPNAPEGARARRHRGDGRAAISPSALALLAARSRAQLPPGSDDRAQVQADHRRGPHACRRERQAPRRAAAPARGREGTRRCRRRSAASKSVSGSVASRRTRSARSRGTETLFVFARSEGGPRVPLAVMRASARELPMRFALDDTQAMAPGVNISSGAGACASRRASRAAATRRRSPATSSARAPW